MSSRDKNVQNCVIYSTTNLSMPQLSAVRGVYNLLFFLGLAPLVYFLCLISCTVQVPAKLCWVNYCTIHTQLKHTSHLFKGK